MFHSFAPYFDMLFFIFIFFKITFFSVIWNLCLFAPVSFNYSKVVELIVSVKMDWVLGQTSNELSNIHQLDS